MPSPILSPKGSERPRIPPATPNPRLPAHFLPGQNLLQVWGNGQSCLGHEAADTAKVHSGRMNSPAWGIRQSVLSSIPASDPMALARLVLIRVPLSFKATTDPSHPEHGMGTKVAWVLGVDRAE